MSKRGRRPYGYYKYEQAMIDMIKLKARRRKGGGTPGYSQIAAEMNRDGYRSQTGKPFSGNMIKNILQRMDKKPKRHASRIKTTLESSDFLTKKELRLCRKVLRDSDAMIFETLLGTGLRASELCRLKIRDCGIYRDKSQIDVRRGKGRKKKGRSVDITAKFRTKLRRYIRTKRPLAGPKEALFINWKGQPLTYKNLYYAIKRIAERAGIQTLHPHVLRHTYATILYNDTNDLFYVMQQLGHSNTKTTEIYAKTLRTKVTGYMRKLDRSLYDG